MKTKITALFIAVLMILSSVLMVSCGSWLRVTRAMPVIGRRRRRSDRAAASASSTKTASPAFAHIAGRKARSWRSKRAACVPQSAGQCYVVLGVEYM